ncbi:MAG: HD domain-containing protein [Patescibacteria group bacterium]
MDDIQQILNFLKESRKFQHVFRHTPHPDGRWENDAEHSWAVAFICMVLATRLEKEFDIKLDQARMLKMALIHDLAEIGTGDTKTWDTASRVGKEEKEKKAMNDLVKLLPKDISEEMMLLWLECEKKETVEAKIVKSVDRFDPVIHRTAFRVGWENVIEEEHATIEALDGRQLPRHSFSKVLTEVYKNIRDEAVKEGFFKTS